MCPTTTIAMLLCLGFSAQGEAEEGAVKLWKEVDVSAYAGSFVSPGDLDGDGRLDFLLSQMGLDTAPKRLVAVDLTGKKLWEVGEAGSGDVAQAGRLGEPTCRGIAAVYDVDHDGKSEVLAELWQGDELTFCLIEGATGKILRQIPSPFDKSVRHPEGFRPSRPCPWSLIAYTRGRDELPTIVLKYEASNSIPCHAVGFDAKLNRLWHVETRPTGMGHHPDVADLDGDGCEEIILGETILGAGGKIVWQKDIGIHADFAVAADVAPAEGKEVLLSICQRGPAYCFDARGNQLWAKSREEVSHGQGVWTGNFLPDQPGLEAIILCSGHVGDFLTVAAEDGKSLARFQHATLLKGYPDVPTVANWLGPHVQSLWLPVDRRLVDGNGKTVADLGPYDERVIERLASGTSKGNLAPQAIPLDVCGDARHELVLYQPYRGRSIFIFTQPDGRGDEKPYVAQPAGYNFRHYF